MNVSGWNPTTKAADFVLNPAVHPNGFTHTIGGTVYRGDKLFITFTASSIVKAGSTTQFDGDFPTNPTSLSSTNTSKMPSGNGVPGGNMPNFRVIVLPGDFNRDNKVDLSDFGIWSANQGTGTTYAQGDADGVGDVDAADGTIMNQNFGKNWTTW